jgi:alcohol dehydrogenase class IV
MTRLARFLDLPTPSFDAVLAWILELRQQLAIPHSLAAIGVDDRRADEVVRKAAADGNAPTNPLPVGAAELRGILDQALRGAL